MSWSWLPLTLGLVAAGLAIAGPALAHLEWTAPLTGLAVFVCGGVLGLVAIVAGGIEFGFRRRVRGLIGACVGFVPAVMLGVPLLIAADYPRINDISTDLVDPPMFRSAPIRAAAGDAPLDYPARFVSIVKASYPDVVSQQLAMAPETALAAAAAQISANGWTLTRRDDDAGELEAVVTTQLFRFRDDVIVRIRPVTGDATKAIIDLRSRSRIGTGDYGKNAQRIRRFLSDLSGSEGRSGG